MSKGGRRLPDNVGAGCQTAIGFVPRAKPSPMSSFRTEGATPAPSAVEEERPKGSHEFLESHGTVLIGKTLFLTRELLRPKII